MNTFAAERQIETKLQQQVLQSVIDSTRESAIVVDLARRIVVSNGVSQTAFSRDGESLQGRRLSEVFRDLTLHEAFTAALESGISSDVRLDVVGSGRRSFDVHVSTVEIGETRLAIGIFYDVTRLERLEKVRQEFLSNISHELRTPLTSIIAFVETLEDGAIDDAENNRRFLGVIRRNAERMHELISDILELSMIESGNVSINTKTVNLRNIVDEVFTVLSSKASKRAITLQNSVEPSVRLEADPVRLEQVLTNLIDNGIKFNRESGGVVVTAKESAGKIAIYVADTGEGILHDHLARVFERFYRADRGRSRDIGGTGLGLAIVKHLVRLHGGEVSVSSILNEGTTFKIELPS